MIFLFLLFFCGLNKKVFFRINICLFDMVQPCPLSFLCGSTLSEKFSMQNERPFYVLCCTFEQHATIEVLLVVSRGFDFKKRTVTTHSCS